MLSKRIIPCLDVTAGRVVKGVNFVGLRDAGDPVEIARRYNEQGADELTFLDITATSDDRDLILHIIEDVASQVFIPLTVGGGVRKVEDVRRLLNAGADKISMNSSAVANPQLLRRFLIPGQRTNACQRVLTRIRVGKCTRMEDVNPRVLMRYSGQKKWMNWVRVKFYSPVWTEMACKMALI